MKLRGAIVTSPLQLHTVFNAFPAYSAMAAIHGKIVPQKFAQQEPQMLFSMRLYRMMIEKIGMLVTSAMIGNR